LEAAKKAWPVGTRYRVVWNNNTSKVKDNGLTYPSEAISYYCKAVAKHLLTKFCKEASELAKQMETGEVL
jgi:hypothetical protein